jgi:hypothetical protein
MFTKCKTTKDQGNIGLASAIAYFSKQCYTISVPLNDSQDYDLVVDMDNVLHKVQVKTTKYKEPSGNYCVTLKSSGGTTGGIYGRVGESSCTLLFILCGNGDTYIVPRDAYKDLRSSMTLGDKYFDYLVI